MSNGKSIGVAYADPLFESLDVSGAVNLTGGDFNITTTSTSTDGATSVEPVLVSTTMTGTGGVGGQFLVAIQTRLKVKLSMEPLAVLLAWVLPFQLK